MAQAAPAKSRTKPRRAKARESYHHGDLRKTLIETGLRIVRQDGAQKLSLREAARLAGVSEAAPYRHFPSKEALLAAIAEDGHAKLRQLMLDGARAHAGDPLEQLQARAWKYTEFAIKETDHFRLIFGGALMPLDGEKYAELYRTSRQCFAELTEIVQASQDAGLVSKAKSARLTATHFWCSVHGMTSLLVDQHLDSLGVKISQAKPFVREHVDSILRGFRESAAQKTRISS